MTPTYTKHHQAVTYTILQESPDIHNITRVRHIHKNTRVFTQRHEYNELVWPVTDDFTQVITQRHDYNEVVRESSTPNATLFYSS